MLGLVSSPQCSVTSLKWPIFDCGVEDKIYLNQLVSQSVNVWMNENYHYEQQQKQWLNVISRLHDAAACPTSCITYTNIQLVEQPVVQRVVWIQHVWLMQPYIQQVGWIMQMSLAEWPIRSLLRPRPWPSPFPPIDSKDIEVILLSWHGYSLGHRRRPSSDCFISK